MNTDILIKVGVGAICGATLGVVGATVWEKYLAKHEEVDEVAYIPRERFESLENDLVERVTANVKDAFTLYSDEVTKVSEAGMRKWMAQNSVKSPHTLIWYVEDEVMGELLNDTESDYEHLIEADWEDIQAAWTEELRLTPSVTSACYIFDGEAFTVNLGYGSFADAYDSNSPDTPIYPEE